MPGLVWQTERLLSLYGKGGTNGHDFAARRSYSLPSVGCMAILASCNRRTVADVRPVVWPERSPVSDSHELAMSWSRDSHEMHSVQRPSAHRRSVGAKRK